MSSVAYCVVFLQGATSENWMELAPKVQRKERDKLNRALGMLFHVDGFVSLVNTLRSQDEQEARTRNEEEGEAHTVSL